MYIDINSINFLSAIIIINSKIHNNLAYDSVVYVNTKNMEVDLISSGFTNNVGSCMYLLQSHLLCRSVVFANNSVDNGGALYIGQGSTIGYGETVQFIINSAVEHGGAVYLNLMNGYPIQTWNSILNISFVKNTASISGNSLYIYIPTQCKVERNFSDSVSLLYVSCQFNYSQPVNGKMMHIPCDLDYTLLNGTELLLSLLHIN